MGSACEVCKGNTGPQDPYCEGCGAGRVVPPEERVAAARARVDQATAELQAAHAAHTEARSELAEAKGAPLPAPVPVPAPDQSAESDTETPTVPKSERGRTLLADGEGEPVELSPDDEATAPPIPDDQPGPDEASSQDDTLEPQPGAPA